MNVMFSANHDAVFTTRYHTLLIVMLDVARAFETQLDSPTSAEALQALDAEFPSISSAMEAFAAEEDAAPLLEVATDLYLALCRYLDVRGLWDEWQVWGWSLVPENVVWTPDVRVLTALGVAYQRAGDPRAALKLRQMALDYGKDQGYPTAQLAQLYLNLAIAQWQSGDLLAALGTCHDGLASARQAGDLVMARMLLLIANLYEGLDKFQESLELLLTVLALAEDIEDRRFRGEVNATLAITLLMSGLPQEAMPFFEAALNHYGAIGDQIAVADTQIVYAYAKVFVGDEEAVAQLTTDSSTIMAQYQDRVFAQVVQWTRDLRDVMRGDQEGDQAR